MEDNKLKEIYNLGKAFNEAIEAAGITEEQGEKFLSKFTETHKQLKEKNDSI